MNADSVYIINRFAQQGTLNVQVTNMPDTMNVSVTNPDVYSESVSHIDSIISQISQSITPLINETIWSSTSFDILKYWAIPLVIALIAMSAPLLLTNINELDSKYHSTRILNAFKQTKEFKFLKYTILIIGLSVLVKFFTWENPYSSIFLIVSSIVFLFSIVFLCIRLTTFYNYSELAAFLIKKYQSMLLEEEKDKVYLYYALIDCLKYAIRQNDKKQTEDILLFFDKDIKNHKYYIASPSCRDFIWEISELICREDNPLVLYKNEEDRYSLPISFLVPNDDATNIGVSIAKQSYPIIWETLLLYVIYNKDELLLSYWDTAQNYYQQGARLDSIEDYIIFHEKFGAMLMAYHKYDTLCKIIYWTEKPQKDDDILKLFRARIFMPQEKLISLKPETFMLRYIRLMYAIDHDNSHTQIPHISATEEMPNPIKEFAKQYMALLYLLSCKTADEQKYFYYEEGEDLQLPESINIETIQKQTNDLVKTAQKLLKNEDLRNSFIHLKALDNVPSLNHFVEAMRDYLKLKTRVADIIPEVYEHIDKMCLAEYQTAYKDFVLPKAKDGRGKQKLKLGVPWIFIGTKEEINKVNFPKPVFDKIKEKVYVAVVNQAVEALEKLNIDKKITCSNDQFIEKIDDILSEIKDRDKYILICDDSRGENVFANSSNYKKTTYKDVTVQFLPITSKSEQCNFWLLKKTYVPSYNHNDDSPNKDLYGYLFTKIEDNEFHSQRIIMDIGRVTTEVFEKLSSSVPDKLIPKGRTLRELLIIAGYIPMSVYIKPSSVIAYKFEVTGIHVYPEGYNPQWDEEEPQEEYIDSITITPEEHNKKLK